MEYKSYLINEDEGGMFKVSSRIMGDEMVCGRFDTEEEAKQEVEMLNEDALNRFESACRKFLKSDIVSESVTKEYLCFMYATNYCPEAPVKKVNEIINRLIYDEKAGQQ